MKRIFTDKELDYIKDNYVELTYKQITEDINSFNDICKTEKQVRTKAAILGFSKRKYHLNRRFFQNIDSEEKAYWLGFIYADGYIVQSNDGTGSEVSIELMESDHGHLEKFNMSLEGNLIVDKKVLKDRFIKGNFVKGGKLSSVIRIYSSDMARDLISHDVLQNKTYLPNFPKVKDELFLHFLRGFFDGDGTLSYSKGILSVAFTNANMEFLKYIKENIDTLCGVTHAGIYSEYETKNRLIITSECEKHTILDAMYKNSKIYLDRKYNLYKKLQPNRIIA